MVIFLLSLILTISYAFEYPEGDPNVVSFEVLTCGNVNRQQVEDSLENNAFFHGELFTVEIDDTTFLASVTDADEMIKPFETLAIRLQQYLTDIFNCAMKVKNVQHMFSELVPEQDSLLETNVMTLLETSDELRSESPPPQVLDLRPKIPGGVRSQGSWSTCVAFAAATMKSYQENVDYGLNQFMSPRFIYAFRKNFPGRGMVSLGDVGHILRTFGSIQEKKMPYSGMNRNQDENSISAEIKAEALEHRVTHASIAGMDTRSYQNNVHGFKDIMKRAINDHGVGIMTTAVFNFGCEMWRHSPKFHGWHAMAVVGYTDGGIIIQNSWGKRWCRGGYTFVTWEEAVKRTKSYYFTQDLSSPGYKLIEENALCSNRGSTGGLDSRYSKKVTNFAACNAFVESNVSCGKFFNFGTDGSCDCVPVGSFCGNTPSKDNKVYQRSHYQNPSPYVMIRNWHVCGNRGSWGGRDSRYSKNVANIGACFAFVESSASCGGFFSLGPDGWCDCVPAGSTCGDKYQPRYKAYRRSTYRYPIYSLIDDNALCNNRGSKDGIDSRYSKKVANIGACSAFVESNGSCGKFFSFGTDGSCDCVPVGSTCGNTPTKKYKAYTRLNYEDPTMHPTTNPTKNPTEHPTYDPTAHPTTNPTNNPTRNPTYSPPVMIQGSVFCGNRGSRGGKDSRYSKNVANFEACRAFVESSASCGDFFSLGADGFCDCVPSGSTCGVKYQRNYNAYARSIALTEENAVCINRGSLGGQDSRYSKKVKNMRECSAFVESSASCGEFFNFSWRHGWCDCIPVGSTCGNTVHKDYNVYKRLNYQEKFREISGWSGCKWDHTVLSLSLTECADLASEKGFSFFTHGADANSYIHCAFYARCTVVTYGPTEHAMKLYEITDNGK